MTAKELHEAFISACEQCPQFQGFDEDQLELSHGHYIDVINLYKKGISAVVKYWSDNDTVGGSLIHDRGYSAELPVEVLNLLEKIDSVVNKAISDMFESYV